MKYYTIVTEVGANAITQATVQGKKVNITHFAVGDGNGNYYEPNASMTSLKREKWRGEVSKYEIDKLSSNIIKVSAIIPQNIGGFTMREMGLFDDKNSLIAVCNTPDLVKVILEDGISTEVEVSMRIAVTNTDVIQFNVDPTVIMATKKDIENAIDIHSLDENVHKNLFDLKANKDLSNVTQQTIINKINSTGNGNTLNADTVDGKHAAGFVQYFGTIPEEIFVDSNYKINYEGIINGISTDVSNLPDMGWYKIKYFRHIYTDGYGTQIAIPYSSHTTGGGNIYWRNSNGAGWENWKKLNDGGDADTVDGKHASDLQNYNNLTNKPANLPANGGNADTVDGKHATDLQNYNNLTNKPESLPANGGNADTVDGKHYSDLTSYADTKKTEAINESKTYTNTKVTTINTTLDKKLNTSDLLNYLKANDGTGSGIDADLLDGRDSAGFAQYFGAIPEEIFVDSNYKINYEGIINSNISADVSGLPDTGFYKVKYFRHIYADGYGTQIAIPYSSHATAGGNIYWRNSSGARWQSWEKLNDGGNAKTIEGYSVSSLLDYFKEEVSVIKSIQRGVASSNSITISEIDPSKSFVILNTTDKVDVPGTGGATSRLGCYLNSLSATKLSITTNGSQTSWQVIEFN